MGESNNNLKYISLVTLTLQNALLGLSMRYARTRDGDMFVSSTAVLMAEFVKLGTCLAIIYVQLNGLNALIEAVRTKIIGRPMDTLKMCIPSFVYVVQNNLLYVSASHLDAATYQVTYQLKILTTAMFAVIILRKQLRSTQWLSLLTLVVGVVLVQLASSPPTHHAKNHGGGGGGGGEQHEQNRFVGFTAALTASLLSGFAGIYLEKMLKDPDITIWMRNVQLSMCSIPFGLITCFVYNGDLISRHGFFYGYDNFIKYLIILQACGGIIVAVVVKYADNILKGFATSLAIVISCIASMYLFEFVLTAQFAMGALLVILSIFLYGHEPKQKVSISGIKV